MFCSSINWTISIVQCIARLPVSVCCNYVRWKWRFCFLLWRCDGQFENRRIVAIFRLGWENEEHTSLISSGDLSYNRSNNIWRSLSLPPGPHLAETSLDLVGLVEAWNWLHVTRRLLICYDYDELIIIWSRCACICASWLQTFSCLGDCRH